MPPEAKTEQPSIFVDIDIRGSSNTPSLDLASPNRWSVKLSKAAGKLYGIGVFEPDDRSDTASVNYLQEGGLAEAFNQKNPDLAIKKGDVIISVNEATELDEIMKQLKTVLRTTHHTTQVRTPVRM